MAERLKASEYNGAIFNLFVIYFDYLFQDS